LTLGTLKGERKINLLTESKVKGLYMLIWAIRMVLKARRDVLLWVCPMQYDFFSWLVLRKTGYLLYKSVFPHFDWWRSSLEGPSHAY
jgi:hypothetical protein